MLSFIVPVRNDADHLRRCLSSINESAQALPFELIVADNGSTDESARVGQAAGARVLSLPKLRVSSLRNAAARVARGDVLAFIDADHEIDSGWSRAALDLLGDESIVAVGAQYRAPGEGTWVQRMYDRFRRHRRGCHEVTWLPSGNLAVRRASFERVGGFDTSLETCEDVDFCQRLVSCGGRLLSSDALRSTHYGDPQTLKALFLGELWRGRDNLRVSVRAPLTLRGLPGILIPVVNVLALAIILLGALIPVVGGPALIVAGTAVFALLTTVRAWSLLWQPESSALSVTVMAQAVVVAGVYDAARALALVAPAGHELRRRR
jgi:cellulose synthase/poly-beta-1,6-N-acetylglucosamine synthase-like glycosyltransferase